MRDIAAHQVATDRNDAARVAVSAARVAPPGASARVSCNAMRRCSPPDYKGVVGHHHSAPAIPPAPGATKVVRLSSTPQPPWMNTNTGLRLVLEQVGERSRAHVAVGTSTRSRTARASAETCAQPLRVTQRLGRRGCCTGRRAGRKVRVSCMRCIRGRRVRLLNAHALSWGPTQLGGVAFVTRSEFRSSSLHQTTGAMASIAYLWAMGPHLPSLFALDGASDSYVTAEPRHHASHPRSSRRGQCFATLDTTIAPRRRRYSVALVTARPATACTRASRTLWIALCQTLVPAAP